jgi:uncharacterized LabA/DUF88 family protein
VRRPTNQKLLENLLSKNVAMFVDVANMYYAARGQDVDVDYVALLKHATKGRDLIRAYAYTGLDPENENQRKFIDFLAKNGYKPVVKDIRKFGDGRVKANLDIELVVDLFRLQDRMDVAVIVSGDGDFAPAIRALQDVGVRCEVISFRPNTSSDLIAVADEFFDIMKVASISRKRDEKAPVMPEMPAKESTPEFGFRDASPAVAAAALAALKSGTGPTRATRGGRPARRAPARPADEPEVEAPIAAIAIEDGSASEAGEGRRRRRRRGGRGRGRGRAREAAAEEGAVEGGAADGPPEIGWQEFDDLSELEGLADEREYTFEEADPETLAELGLLDEPVIASATAEQAAEPEATVEPQGAVEANAPTPRSRGRRSSPRSADASAGSEGAKPRRRRAAAPEPVTPEQPADQPKPRRRARAAAPQDQEAPAATASDKEAIAAATKPRRRSRSAPKSEVSTPASDDQPQPEGIWQRFRSARENNPGS